MRFFWTFPYSIHSRIYIRIYIYMYHIISYHISYIIYHISYIIYHISYIIYHIISHIISYIISYVISHIISYHISYIIYHIISYIYKYYTDIYDTQVLKYIHGHIKLDIHKINTRLQYFQYNTNTWKIWNIPMVILVCIYICMHISNMKQGYELLDRIYIYTWYDTRYIHSIIFILYYKIWTIPRFIYIYIYNRILLNIQLNGFVYPVVITYP